VIQEQQEVLDKQATLDKQVLQVSVVRRVQLVTLEQLDSQEHKEILVLVVNLDLLEQQEIKDY